MGQATIFNGQKIKTLKDTLTLNGKSDIISSTVDPTASAVDAPIGSLLINQTSGKLYRKLDAGSSVNWEEVGAGVGGINYILNPSAEVNTTGWATYADAAGAAPVDGTGGSPNVTWTRSTTTPLRGVADFNFVKDAANRQGQGVSYDFTIANADKAKVLSVTFDYEVLSGTYADGDLTVYLIADPTGTPVVIQPAGYTVSAATVGTTMREVATFQTQATATSYRLCFHVASTSASAYTLAIDNVVVGPQQTVQGAAISDWVEYTPVLSASTPPTYSGASGRYRRVGDTLEVMMRFLVTAGGSGTYTFSLPTFAKIDFTKLSQSTTGDRGIGQGLGYYNVSGGSGPYRQSLVADFLIGSDSTFIALKVNGTALNSADFSGTPTQMDLWMTATVPIQGWSSNTVLSQDTDTRVVAARAFSSNSGAWPTTDTVINFATVSYDTHSVITTGAGWNYRIPVSGYYKVSASHAAIASGATTLVLRLRRNGAEFANGTYPTNVAITNIVVRVDGQNYFNAGDTLDIVASSTAATGLFVNSISGNVVQIERLSGPATIAASETVAMRYKGSTTAISNSPNQTVYNTKDYDTHNAYNSSTGVYTFPISGKYRISASIWTQATYTSGNQLAISVLKSSDEYILSRPILPSAAAVIATASGSTEIQVLAGEQITIAVSSLVSSTPFSDNRGNWLSISRIGN